MRGPPCSVGSAGLSALPERRIARTDIEPPPLAGIESLLPLLGDLRHRLFRLTLAGPDALERLGQEVTARIDRKVGASLDGDLALFGELHTFHEGAAHLPGRARRLVVRLAEDRLAWRGAAAGGGPQEAVVGEPLHGSHRGIVPALVFLRVELQAALLEIGDALAPNV